MYFNIISHLCSGLPSCHLPPGFPTNPLNISFLLHMCHILHSSHPSWFDHNKLPGEQYGSCIHNLLQSPATLSPLGPNIFLSILVSTTGRQKFWSKWQQAFPRYNLLLLSACMDLIPSYLNSSTSQREYCLCLCCDFILHYVHQIRTHT